MGNAEIFISFLANLLISASKHVTLNQRVQGSSPCAPTKNINISVACLMVRQTPCLPYLGVHTVSTKASGSGRRSRHIAGLLHETGERQLRQWTKFARSVSSRRWGKSPGPLPGDSPSDNGAWHGGRWRRVSD